MGTHPKTGHFQQNLKLIFQSVFNEILTFITLRTKTWKRVGTHSRPTIHSWEQHISFNQVNNQSLLGIHAERPILQAIVARYGAHTIIRVSSKPSTFNACFSLQRLIELLFFTTPWCEKRLFNPHLYVVSLFLPRQQNGRRTPGKERSLTSVSYTPPRHAVPWSLDICFSQRSPVHQVETHRISNRDIHLYPPHNNSSVHLRTTYVRRSGRITDGRRSGWRTLRDSVLSSNPVAGDFGGLRLP